MNTNEQKRSRVIYPEYWAKRKGRLNPELIKELEETAAREPSVADDYGEYKPGTFLYRDVVVTVKNESQSGWSVHIFGEHSIGLPLIKEVRYKYVPDHVLMVQILGSREDDQIKGVLLHEIPSGREEE
jgi:hypothetical protein